MTIHLFCPRSTLKSASYNSNGGVLQKDGFSYSESHLELSIVLGSRTANMIEVQSTLTMFAADYAVPLSRFEKGGKNQVEGRKEVLVRAHGKYECNSQENVQRCR